MLATPVQARSGVGPGWPAPLYVLEVRLWDLPAARRLAGRLRAAGVEAEQVRVSGRRVADGLVESDVRPARRLTTRWRTNVVVALTAAVVVGIPMGASLGLILLGEHAAIMAAGATAGGVALASAGLWGVWGDHFQRIAGTRPTSRVEGVLTVTGDRSVVRAELLLATCEDVMGVSRRPQVVTPGRAPVSC